MFCNIYFPLVLICRSHQPNIHLWACSFWGCYELQMRYGLWSELVRKVCARSWTPTGEMMGGFWGFDFVLVIFDTNKCRYVGFSMVLVKSVHKHRFNPSSVWGMYDMWIQLNMSVDVAGVRTRQHKSIQSMMPISLTNQHHHQQWKYHHHHHHHHHQQQQQQQQKQQHLHDLHMFPIITTTLPKWCRLIDHQAPVIDLANGTYHTAGPRLS